MKILHIVGARPNFMKIAPLLREMDRHPDIFKQVLLHTGQHYDAQMSQVFFDELGLPKPNLNLDVGSGTHARQTAQIMLRFEPVLRDVEPDWVVVVGDVNSTVACALVCSKLGVPIAHVEAGLRSFDRSMPEEINRLLTDQLADLLFTHSPEADENLLREGIPAEKIHFVGNIMIDTLIRLIPHAQQRWPALKSNLAIEQYQLVTLHRPANVDDPQVLEGILTALYQVSRDMPVLFPVHPRTKAVIDDNRLSQGESNLRFLDPLGYLDFLALQMHAALVVTDSGGIQEETTYLGVPCLTVRPNTERPVTITQGTNRLVAADPRVLYKAVQEYLAESSVKNDPPALWDGNTAERIVEVFMSLE